MQIIQIEENQKEIWNEFIAENCSESFLQSWEWGKFQENLGKKVWRIGVVDNDLSGKNKTSKSQIKNHKFQNSQPKTDLLPRRTTAPWAEKFYSMALIVKYDLPFGWSYLYCPRGPVINESGIRNLSNLAGRHESRMCSMLFSEIKKTAKKEKSLFLKIDSPVETNYEYFSKFKKSPNEVQPRDTLMLDLEKPKEDLLKEMKQKTRYNIRLAEKKGTKITNYKLCVDNKKEFKEKFERFWELAEETSRRDKFRSHNKDYYWKMLESLNKENCACDRKLLAKLYLAEYNNKVIASNIVLYFGNYCVYLHGASSNECRNVMAPYLLQWQQIIDAKKAGYKKYDFWGINSSQKLIKSKAHKVKDSWQGITRFKKGFGGYEKNYIGAYELVFNNIEYTIYKSIKSIKSKVLKNLL
ncbi:MAG: peptidoglycan bridge formation glycyltransferase FemA/FemB family protein [Candidatus Pacebacteria bacterium]|nr:peptidoglycan bridge formation glycyltransferase FemA/FemB family protein [Candidatus Paceibacterota bacterium]